MNLKFFHSQRHRATTGGFTIIEMLTSVGIASVLLTGVAFLFINGSMSFLAVANYQNLDSKSTVALDTISKEIRNATAVMAYTTNSLVLTNASASTCTILAYDPTAKTLVMTKTGQAAKTNLTGCDLWTFSIYNKVLSNGIAFYVATNAAQCKLISMTWKCSRTILGSKLNTESVQTAQVVLRNHMN